MDSVFNFTLNGMMFHICKSDARSCAAADPEETSAYVAVGEMKIGCESHVIYQCVPSERAETEKNDIASLTRRELQIVVLVAEGHVNKVIGTKLNISEWTVSTHLRRIFAKLRVDSRSEMVYRCAKLIDIHKIIP